MPRYGHIEIQGISRLLFHLRTDQPFHAPAWRAAVQEATLLVKQEAMKTAPSATGHLRASITSRLDPRPVPRWGIVSTDATAADGTRYPFVLNAGHRTPKRTWINAQHVTKKGRVVQRWKASKRQWRAMTAKAGRWINLHYAGSGRSTRAWLNRALDVNQGRVNSILDKAATAIERRWSS